MTELSNRLVNALTHAERLPKDEWDAEQTRLDRQDLIAIREQQIAPEEKYRLLVEWVDRLLAPCAAAPDLLIELKLCRRLLAELHAKHRANNPVPAIVAALKLADITIAKAKG